MHIACKGVSRRTGSMESEVNKRIGLTKIVFPLVFKTVLLPLYSCKPKI